MSPIDSPAHLSVYSSLLPPPGDLSKPEIELVQSRLREMGYHTVGKVDGVWGPLTTGAIASLQATAEIPVTGRYDDRTRAAMQDDRNRREISPERAHTTAADLRLEGSQTIKEADRVTVSSALLTVISLAVAFVTFVVEHWDEASQMAEAVKPVLEWVPAPVWPVVVAAFGSFLWVRGRNIKTVRVEAERTGVHNGEPGTEPIAEGAKSATGGS